MGLVVLAGQAYCLKSGEWSHWQERACQGRSAGVTCLRATRGLQPPGPFSPLDHPGERKLRWRMCPLFGLFFSREKSNSEAVFQVLSLFCQCQGDMLCHIT